MKDISLVIQSWLMTVIVVLVLLAVRRIIMKVNLLNMKMREEYKNQMLILSQERVAPRKSVNDRLYGSSYSELLTKIGNEIKILVLMYFLFFILTIYDTRSSSCPVSFELDFQVDLLNMSRTNFYVPEEQICHETTPDYTFLLPQVLESRLSSNVSFGGNLLPTNEVLLSSRSYKLLDTSLYPTLSGMTKVLASLLDESVIMYTGRGDTFSFYTSDCLPKETFCIYPKPFHLLHLQYNEEYHFKEELCIHLNITERVIHHYNGDYMGVFATLYGGEYMNVIKHSQYVDCEDIGLDLSRCEGQININYMLSAMRGSTFNYPSWVMPTERDLVSVNPGSNVSIAFNSSFGINSTYSPIAFLLDYMSGYPLDYENYLNLINDEALTYSESCLGRRTLWSGNHLNVIIKHIENLIGYDFKKLHSHSTKYEHKFGHGSTSHMELSVMEFSKLGLRLFLPIGFVSDHRGSIHSFAKMKITDSSVNRQIYLSTPYPNQDGWMSVEDIIIPIIIDRENTALQSKFCDYDNPMHTSPSPYAHLSSCKNISSLHLSNLTSLRTHFSLIYYPLISWENEYNNYTLSWKSSIIEFPCVDYMDLSFNFANWKRPLLPSVDMIFLQKNYEYLIYVNVYIISTIWYSLFYYLSVLFHQHVKLEILKEIRTIYSSWFILASGLLIRILLLLCFMFLYSSSSCGIANSPYLVNDCSHGWQKDLENSEVLSNSLEKEKELIESSLRDEYKDECYISSCSFTFALNDTMVNITNNFDPNDCPEFPCALYFGKHWILFLFFSTIELALYVIMTAPDILDLRQTETKEGIIMVDKTRKHYIFEIYLAANLVISFSGTLHFLFASSCSFNYIYTIISVVITLMLDQMYMRRMIRT